MREFTIPVEPTEFLVPFSMASVLFVGVILMLYLFVKIKTRRYLIVFLASVLALIFVTSMGLMTVIGGLYLDEYWGMRIYRFGQNAVTFMLIVFLAYASSYLKLSQRIHKFLNVTMAFTSIFVAIVVVITYLVPDLFLSITEQNPYAFTYTRQSMWGRGASGIVYSIRDIYSVFIIFLLLFFLLYDLFINKLFNFATIASSIGLLCFLYGAADDLLSFRINRYLLLSNIAFSRFAIGCSIFIGIIIIHTFRLYVKEAIIAGRTKAELEGKFEKNTTFIDIISTFSRKISSVSENVNTTAHKLRKVAEKTIDTLFITKLYANRLIATSQKFSDISNSQKKHIHEIIGFNDTLFTSLKDIRQNIDTQKDKIESTIEYTSKLTFTMDTMNEAMGQITSVCIPVRSPQIHIQQWLCRQRTSGCGSVLCCV